MDNKKGPLVILLFLVIIVIVVVAIIFASKLFNKGGTTSGNVEISYIGLWDSADIYEPLIQEYQAAHPKIKITYTEADYFSNNNLTYKSTYQTSAEERLINGTSDIIRVHQTWIPKLQAYLSGAPTDIFSGAEAKEIYYTAISDAIVSANNIVYGAPQIIDGLVLIYNKELFARANITDPKNATKDWDVTLVTAKVLAKKNLNGTLSIGGINMGSVANVRSSPEILLTMLTQSAIPIVSVSNASTGKLTASFATDAGAAAINRYYEFAKLGTWSSTMTNDDVQAFQKGKLAMLIAPSWRVINIKAANSALDIDTLPLPILPGANPSVPQFLASYWIDVVSKKSKHPKESWEFLKWLGEPAQLRKLYAAQKAKRGMGNPYPRKDMASEQASEPYIGPVLEMAPRMKSWPLYDYGIWEETLRKGLLEFEDRGGITTSSLQEIQGEINNLTLKR